MQIISTCHFIISCAAEVVLEGRKTGELTSGSLAKPMQRLAIQFQKKSFLDLRSGSQSCGKTPIMRIHKSRQLLQKSAASFVIDCKLFKYLCLFLHVKSLSLIFYLNSLHSFRPGAYDRISRFYGIFMFKFHVSTGWSDFGDLPVYPKVVCEL